VPKSSVKRKLTSPSIPRNGLREIAAGEFKAKCLAIIDEVNETGQEVIITKRGKAAAKLIPFPQPEKRKSFIGRLEGIIEIVGDPDDLIKPVFPEEDWDMLK
jgi:prevent-host-death family protein